MHVVSPIRHLIPGANFRAEEVIGIDINNQTVTTGSQITGRERELHYDHLVLALGNVIDLSRIPGAAQHGKTIKTLGDAIAIRNHVLQMLEAADIETDPATRREMLTFVVAGAGFSGVELIGELNDLVHEVIEHFPSIGRDQVKIILLHSRDRILPEVSTGLAEYALTELRKRGVEVRLNVRLASATPHEAILEGGTRISTRSLIVAIGNSPPPVINSLDIEKERGKIVVDEYMRLPNRPGLWSLGDNAIVPNAAADDGSPSPPTAQYALRQGKQLAKNIAASIRGKKLSPFAFGGLGLLCLVGHGAGVGDLPGGIRVKGFLGWFLWRSVYWSKIPSFGRKVQVGVGWLLDLFLPRDLTQLNLSRTQTIGRAHYESGENIIKQGDPGDHFYMILEGEVEVIRERSGGKETVLNRLGKGEYFGETALLTRRSRNATVRSITPVDVITLGRDDFAILANTWLELADNLMSVSQEREAEHRSFTWVGNLRSLSSHGQTLVGVLPTLLDPQKSLAHLLRRDTGGEVTLEGNLNSIGRSGENNIVVDDKAVSRRHALIQREDNVFIVEDLGGTNGTVVNGHLITERIVLNDNDVIRIGKSEFVFRAPEGDGEPEMSSQIQFAQIVRGSTGEEITLENDLTSIGRSPENHIVIADASASRRHALIQREGESYLLEDLGGPNGTSVNGVRVTERTMLKSSDEISIGDTGLTFIIIQPEPAIPSVPLPKVDGESSVPPHAEVTLVHDDIEPDALPQQAQAPAATPAPIPPAAAAPPPPAPAPAAPPSAPDSPPPPSAPAPAAPPSVPDSPPPAAESPPSEPAFDPSITNLVEGLDVDVIQDDPALPGDPPQSSNPNDPSITNLIEGLDAPPATDESEESTEQLSASDIEGESATMQVDISFAQLTLQVTDGPAKGSSYQIVEGENTLGRSSSSTIQLNDNGLSRQHCQIDVLKDGQFIISDLNSTNGTFVNQNRLEAPHQLQTGDSIHIGASRLDVTIET